MSMVMNTHIRFWISRKEKSRRLQSVSLCICENHDINKWIQGIGNEDNFC